MSTIIVAGAKGGQGTTTVAASIAVTVAATGRRIALIDTGGDAASILDRPSPPRSDGDLAEAIKQAEAVDGIELVHVPHERLDADSSDVVSALSACGATVVIDAGTDSAVVHRFDDVRPRPRRLLVVRPCYIAVTRAASVPYTPDHVVLVRERLRSLTQHDIERALALPVTVVDHEPLLARAIDAGLLVTHVHRWLGRPLRQLV